MRVNHPDAFPVLNILNSHIFKQGGFTHAGLADNVHMARTVSTLNTEAGLGVAEVGFGEISYVVFAWHSKLLFRVKYNKFTLLNVGRFNGVKNE